MSRIVVHSSVLWIFTFLSVASVTSPALAHHSDPQPCPQDATPVSPEPISNIRVDDLLEPVVSSLLVKSATFRRQWDTISASRFIRVTIGLRLGMQEPGSSRARTDVSHFAYGAIRARIELPNATDLTELLAHELEHVVEQLEGLDLRALARRRGQGVAEVQQGVYETARARAAGLQAYRGGLRRHRPGAGDGVERRATGPALDQVRTGAADWLKNARVRAESAPGRAARTSRAPS